MTSISVAGRSYRVESCDDLVSGLWSVLTNGVDGTGGVMDVIDTGGATATQRFYRPERLRQMFLSFLDIRNGAG